ncbi:hypothetical protein PRIPAC_97596 [Pristionchus pacificus]|uniref:Uncharacterized protein n=1 Tax=Pristionchus pacificus TaxID=54126 RepID=A0A454XN77_PRIPA|nr:hypothetical protein PRIPAC_97596 [Pristionchus pacificus]|eukprot:PDM84542.1 hypothetical protein PRIPAC_33565 [Pristionchus pacificus]
MMRFPLFILSLIAATASNVYSSTCRYDGSTVYETGFAPRPMTSNEVAQMSNYAAQSRLSAVENEQIARGEFPLNRLPTPAPKLPCFCHNCNIMS